MAYQYSTLLTNSFFDTLINALSLGGMPTLILSTAEGVDLVSLPFEEPLVLTRSSTAITLSPPPSAMVSVDGQAARARLISGGGDLIVSFDVGSPTVNPDATLLISSTALYAGGMITLTAVEITL